MDPDLDLHHLRLAFRAAEQARARGDHPFGAVLVGPEGDVWLEQGNGFATDGGDMTAHAKRLLAGIASRRFGAVLLRGCTLYVSAEPCAMCAGAIYWAGIGRVVFGAGQRPVEVVGPLLEDEAARLQDGFWADPA